MRLQAKTRYGVRAVFDIAFHNAGNPTQAKDIARRQEIPLRYLEQIFQDLKRAGIVDSRRGPRGGYYLRKAPVEIRLGDIVRALQGPLDELFAPDGGEDGGENGGGGRRRASANAKVVTASIWRDLAAHVTSWFDGLSVEDLVKKGVALGVERDGKRAPMYFI
jgi:Rrf2 family protein